MLTKNSVIEQSIFLDYVLHQIVQYLEFFRKQAGMTFFIFILVH